LGIVTLVIQGNDLRGRTQIETREGRRVGVKIGRIVVKIGLVRGRRGRDR